MNPDAFEAVGLVNTLLHGCRFERIERFEPSGCGWWFHFDGKIILTIETVWRLVSNATIAVSSEDDGQIFGRKATVDAAAEATSLLADKSVSGVLIEPASARIWMLPNLGRVLRSLARSASVQQPLDAPRGVEPTVRTSGGKNWVFLLNHTGDVQSVGIATNFTDIVTEEKLAGRVSLESYGVRILQAV